MLAIQDTDEEFDHGNSLFFPREDIVNLSGHLIEILADGTVRMIHLSAKEFCMQSREVLEVEYFPMIYEPSAHAELANDLLTLLSLREIASAHSDHDDDRGDAEIPTTTSQVIPRTMEAYAFRSWWVHCINSKACRDAGPLLSQVEKYLDSHPSFR
jgi:hypothetical protein